VFNYQQSDVYVAARRFVKLAFVLANELLRGESELRSQLKRAALSIPLNIAEASGKLTERDRKHVHSVARGSAMECGALLDAVVDLGFADERRTEEGHELLIRTVAMLTRLAR
jgi:four helix bundle protein